MQIPIVFSLPKKTGGRRRSHNIRSHLVSNEGVFIVTSPPDRSTMDMVLSDSNKPGPSNETRIGFDYAYLRRSGQPRSVLRTPSEASFESALSRLEPLPEKPPNAPDSLQLERSRRSNLRKSSSAPETKSRATLVVSQPSVMVIRSQDNLTSKSKHTLRAGLRGPLFSMTPGYIREIPRSLPLKRQLTKTPSYQVPSATDSLYLSWKEYFKTPDPFTNYHSSHLFDSIKMEVPDSIKQFLEEIDYRSPAESLTTVKKIANNQYSPTPESQTGYLALPAPEIYSPDSVIEINVSGECFMVRKSLVRRFPNSLLGSPDIEKYYVKSLNCYFFNRSRFLFEYVLQLYQCGSINLPPNFLSLSQNKAALNRELDFFRLSSELKRKTQLNDPPVDQSSKSQKEEADEMMKILINGPGWTKLRQLKLKLYVFLANPQSSRLSMVWMVFDMILVVLSISSLVVESEPRYKQYFTNKDHIVFKVCFILEILSQTFFTIDFTLRLFSWPRLRSFFKYGMNICDFVSLLPYYVPQLVKLIDGRNVKTLVVFRVIRMCRIARIFRIIRHSHGLLIIFQFLFNSGKELVMLAGLFTILTLLFSSMIYIFESHEETFNSIPASGWWAVVSLTGIGYGDVVPKSAPGQLVAVMAIMTGVIFLALPMTIIITKFTKHMDRHYKG